MESKYKHLWIAVYGMQKIRVLTSVKNSHLALSRANRAARIEGVLRFGFVSLNYEGLARL
jgi:hypothetical protein